MHGTRNVQKVQKGKDRGWTEGNVPPETKRKDGNGAPRRFYEADFEDEEDDSTVGEDE
jgi:hypothetical protein